jgi:hypothetical protein
MILCEHALDPIPYTQTDNLVDPEEFLAYAVSRAPLERSSDCDGGLTALVDSNSGARIVVDSEKLDRFRLS